MPDQNPSIIEKEPSPPGLLPKHVQSWLLAGLALIMILIMWLTGGKKSDSAPKTSVPAPRPAAPVEVNEAKIVELQTRIAQLQREQRIAESALADDARIPNSSAAVGRNQAEELSPEPRSGQNEDPLETERKKRDYTSRFASNIALSYRSEFIDKSAKSALEAVPSQEISQVADLLRGFAAPNGSASFDAAKASQPMQDAREHVEGDDKTEKKIQRRSSAEPLPEGQARVVGSDKIESNVRERKMPSAVASGQQYFVREGTIVEAVLLNRLDGQFSGPVECMVSGDVYSEDRQHILIPSGSKVLGEVRRVEHTGQTRLAILFHRLLLPDGYSANLDQFHGLDTVGDTGLHDQVNNHYLRLFGTSLALGALGAVSEAGAGNSLSGSGTDLMRQGLGVSTAQSATQILDRFLNVLPTVTVREGHRVKVYFSGDLLLPDYGNHRLSGL